MRHALIAVVALSTLGAGCVPSRQPAANVPTPAVPAVARPASAAPAVILPFLSAAVYGPTYKRFGEYFEDRFHGYHVGEDVEVPLEDLGPGEVQEVPVRAIADGTVRHASWVSGYGGVVVIAHTIGGERVNAIYGHLDIASVRAAKGATVARGDIIGVLGEGGTRETDGERQHLHFALYAGDELRLNGYERDARKVRDWINPHDFFIRHGMDRTGHPQMYSAFQASSILKDPQGARVFRLTFMVPNGWDVEYIPSLQALNLYTVSGEGTARDRSQVFIRYFDASDFLTLSTVNVLATKELSVGEDSYRARRYVIEKKLGVPDFTDQPAWRNARHTVTDFRARGGRTRYYVVAANPSLDPAAYDFLLAGIRIIE